MDSMPLRLTRSVPLALLALAASATPAAANDLLSETLSSSATTGRYCTDGLTSGPGVLQRELAMAPASGSVAAVLSASRGDWDVAIFDKQTGKRVAGGAGFGPSEVATGFLGGGRTMIVQACRRSGSATARLKVRSEAVPSAGIEHRPSLVKVFVTDPGQKSLIDQLGFDVTEHAGQNYVEVVAYGAKDLARLTKLGFRYETVTEDLVKEDSARATTDRLFAQKASTRAGRASLRAAGDVVPSGRTEYRHLADYEADLKKLVAENPGLVKPLVLKEQTIEGRAVNGIEITTNVDKTNDGKPVFAQFGVHHAREWPSGEHAIEWAFDVVNGVRSGDPKFTKLASAVRTIVVPVVNVDGFNVSREAPVDLVNDPQFASLADLSGGLNETAAYLVDPALNYKRRNCRLVPDVDSVPAGACATPPFRVSGVDPNRNYGALWGGPGASALPFYDTYRGTGPFSEPETRNVRALVSSRQVTTLITNHTFSNLVLRPPGVKAQGQAVDEPALKDLGDRMAAKNGYASTPSYELYDTTGGTEDWTYGAAGGFGYTFEIGPDEPAAEGGGFHPPFSFTVGQYNNGSNNGGGNRAAYGLAMENAADPAKHATLTGKVPAGVKLKVAKSFVTETSPVEPAQTDAPVAGDTAPSPAGPVQTFPDTLSSELDVEETGAFSWAINPSQRPLTDQNTLPGVATTPTREETFTPKSQTSPNQLDGEGEEGTFEDVPFTVTEADRAKGLDVLLTHDSPIDDYDLVLFRREGAELKPVDDSGNPPGSDEEITVEDPQLGDYVLRVTNYLAFSGWEVKVRRLAQGTDTIRPRKAVESWTLTCEAGGTVLASQKIAIDRGTSLDVKEPCGANAAAVVASVTGRKNAPALKACATSAGFKSVKLKVLGRRKLQLGFSRLVAGPVRVDVFRTSTGTRVLRNRRVATLSKLSRSQTFAPKRLADGYYFARYSMKGARRRADERRLTFRVRKGRITLRRGHHAPNSCGLLSSVKLGSPVFGGRTKQPLRIAIRVARKSDVTVQVLKGAKV
ncbi:MAG: hypothetical protein H0V81_17045, partial [Solirubrobacterales bacterium]|nr:hypothetical protein [Solirubrobacterales bacterium]